MKAIARILLLTLVPLEAVWAVDKSFSKVLHQIQFDSSGGGVVGIGGRRSNGRRSRPDSRPLFLSSPGRRAEAQSAARDLGAETAAEFH